MTTVSLRLFLLFLFCSVNAFPQSTFETVAWAPPTPRLKASRTFSPKPVSGHNVFKGEADKWLADAIIKLEMGELKPLNDKLVNDYVTSVGKNLALYSKAPNKSYEFIVLNDQGERAFTTGGGRIYISLGLLKAVENEDALAGVLGHEIGHDAFAHAGKAVTRQMFWLTSASKMHSADEVEKALAKLNNELERSPVAVGTEVILGFARFAELEADRASFYNLHKAGYNPRWWRKRLEGWNKEEKHEYGKDYSGMQFFEFFFGSHPPTSQRITALKWEATWVEMPPSEQFHKNAAFDAMKAAVAKL